MLSVSKAAVPAYTAHTMQAAVQSVTITPRVLEAWLAAVGAAADVDCHVCVTGAELQRVQIPSHFSHDAVRAEHMRLDQSLAIQ